MNSKDILKLCNGASWQITNGRLRVTEQGRRYCPITYACWVKTGEFLAVSDWLEAAMKINLDSDIGRNIVLLADYGARGLLEKIKESK